MKTAREKRTAKTTSLNKQHNNFVGALRFFSNISLPLLHNYAMNFPIFRFYIGREHKAKIFLIFFELDLHGSVYTGCPSKKIVGSKICRDPCQEGLLKLFA